jgi:hypothetical protein
MQIQLVAAGYTDSVYFFFLFLTFASVSKPYLSALFFALALLSHESCLFLFPFLVLYYWHLHKDNLNPTFKYSVLLILAIIPLALYRYWVNKHISVVYDFHFYFSESNIRFTLEKVKPRIALGLLLVFRSFWALVIYAIYSMIKNKNYSLLLAVAVLILCDLAQLIIAYDITRMLCLCFPIMLISADEVRKEMPENKFLLLLLILLVLNIFIPEYMMTCDGPLKL